MTQETIKTYQGRSIGMSQCLVTLESFIGDMENAELADDSTVDASDAVTAINGVIWEVERCEAEIERLRKQLDDCEGGLLTWDDHRDSLYWRTYPERLGELESAPVGAASEAAPTEKPDV